MESQQSGCDWIGCSDPAEIHYGVEDTRRVDLVLGLSIGGVKIHVTTKAVDLCKPHALKFLRAFDDINDRHFNAAALTGNES